MYFEAVRSPFPTAFQAGIPEIPAVWSCVFFPGCWVDTGVGASGRPDGVVKVGVGAVAICGAGGCGALVPNPIGIAVAEFVVVGFSSGPSATMLATLACADGSPNC